jgi:hypothetical protein
LSSNASEIQWPPQDWRLRITRWPSSIRITIQWYKDRAQSFSFENLATDKPFVDFRILQWRRTRHLRQLTIMSDHRSDQYIQGRGGSACREICVSARGKATLRNLFNFWSQQSFCTDSAVSEKFACTWIQYTTVRPQVYVLMLLHNNMDAIPPCSNCTIHSHLLSRSTHTRTSPVRRTCLNPSEERACVILWQRCEHSTLSSSRLSTIDMNVILRVSVIVSNRSLYSLLTLHGLDILLDRNHVPYNWIVESYIRRK